MILKIKNKKISELIPYISNSRNHSDAQISQIAASIKEFGFNNPVLVDGGDGIVAGHGRVMAAKLLGMTAVPTIELNHLTDSQRRAYIIADNKLSLNAEWDESILQSEIDRLSEDGFDIDILGFEESEMNELLKIDEPEKSEISEEPDPPTATKCKLGDVWLLGDHRLMCGDSSNNESIKTLMDGESWDVCIFDPPYQLIELYGLIPKYRGSGKLAVMWDFKRFAIAANAAIAKGWESQYEFIWDCVQSWYTPNRPLARHKAVGIFCDDPFFDTEKAIIKDGKKREAKTVKNTRGVCYYEPLDGAKNIATVEAFANTQQTDEHGHGKPIQWIKAIWAGIGGDLYFDMFGGSGATLIACEQLGKKCYTMELNPTYCDVIIQRWQNYTENNATNSKTAEVFNK